MYLVRPRRPKTKFHHGARPASTPWPPSPPREYKPKTDVRDPEVLVFPPCGLAAAVARRDGCPEAPCDPNRNARLRAFRAWPSRGEIRKLVRKRARGTGCCGPNGSGGAGSSTYARSRRVCCVPFEYNLLPSQPEHRAMLDPAKVCSSIAGECLNATADVDKAAGRCSVIHRSARQRINSLGGGTCFVRTKAVVPSS